MPTSKTVIGRYAPSPTGDMHLGNLRTALLAWLQARLQNGIILLRMDDLDQLRVVSGSADTILYDLEWMGLDWDGEIVYQSQRTELYQSALQRLAEQGLVYECFCSRKDIQQAASAPHGQETPYLGTCSNLTANLAEIKRQEKAPALRVRVNECEINFIDHCAGECREKLCRSCGDFVIKRADGLFSYQLATAVDDIAQGITDVVRGADLIDSTARQLYLMQRLKPELSKPRYWHVPLMHDDQGERMAKRCGSMSAASWRSDGSSCEVLIGKLAASIGLLPEPYSISAQELLVELTIETFQNAIQNYNAPK
jgi:glutamyl-tRNA synthetase